MSRLPFRGTGTQSHWRLWERGTHFRTIPSEWGGSGIYPQISNSLWMRVIPLNSLAIVACHLGPSKFLPPQEAIRQRETWAFEGLSSPMFRNYPQACDGIQDSLRDSWRQWETITGFRCIAEIKFPYSSPTENISRRKYHFVSHGFQLCRRNIQISQTLFQSCEECHLIHQAQIHLLDAATSCCMPESHTS